MAENIEHLNSSSTNVAGNQEQEHNQSASSFGHVFTPFIWTSYQIIRLISAIIQFVANLTGFSQRSVTNSEEPLSPSRVSHRDTSPPFCLADVTSSCKSSSTDQDD